VSFPGLALGLLPELAVQPLNVLPSAASSQCQDPQDENSYYRLVSFPTFDKLTFVLLIAHLDLH